ncbi:tetratricopeptide (TPR) repeat protein [Azospirillum agricola]|uniref:tetratricopeptide repeat protein n=1 Tax=Azospirillum agricola TaxID=1720247 RepID=UPI001AE549CE|nr:tetratricopeptide repeat protein [Azospirillum agricola]MBP2229316.1 tetratricopeptide (TPR) repeat protein [Azospirillum agricola]
MTGRTGYGTRRWLCGFAAAVALLAVPVASAGAASVPVRAAAHKDFGRMVFDWPTAVGYSARVEDGRLLIAFDQPIDAPLDRAVSALPDYLSGGRVEADGKTVVFDLKRPVTLKSFRNGRSVAVDLSPAAAAATSQPAPSASAPAADGKPAATQPAATRSAATQPAPDKPVASAGRVGVRVADQPEASRVTFDWPAPVEYSVKRDGAAVTVTFDKGGSADLAQAARASLRNVRNIEQFRQPNGALAVTFVVPQDSEVRDSKSGRSVVLDVLNAGTRKGPVAETPAGTITTVRPDPVPAQSPGAPPAAAPVPAPPAPAAPMAPPPKEPPTVASARSGSSAVASNAATASAASPPAEEAKPQPAPGPKGPTLTFETGGPASIAVYPRAGQLYIVFDRPMPIGAGKVSGPGSELMGRIEPVPATGGTAFRTKIGPMVWPTVERKGTTWTVTSSARPVNMSGANDLRIDAEPDFLLGARLLVRAPDAANVVQISDPDVGDRVQVVPLPGPGLGVAESRRYPDLEVMPSYQGVVVRPISDNVTVRPVKEGVELTSAGGLHMSPAADAGNPAAGQPAAPFPQMPQPSPTAQGTGGSPGGSSSARGVAEPQLQGRRLFNLPAWKHGDLDHYTDSRQELQLAVVNAPESERPKAQLDLARFYFANGFGQETLGMLDVLQQGQPDLEGWPEFRALRGAARVLTGDLAGGEADLTVPSLAGNPEAALWRAAIAAEKRDWPAAMAGFKATSGILNSYPDPMIGKLGLRAAEAALETQDPTNAKRLIDRVLERSGPEAEERPDVQYLRGLYYAQTGETDRAREQLQQSYQSLDRLYRAKAGLALTNLELAEGRMSPTAAAEQLAGLTFTWRGDDLEMQIRSRMGEVLIAGGKYAEGFNTMKETAALVADTPRAEAITKDMSRIFADLYKDGAARLPTLEALQLYDQFRELTPVGEAGDEIIRQLAERLIAVDLLNRAADLLQHQVEYRLAGQDKARIGTRLASIRLLDNKPEEALKALELSNVPGIPADLMAERRLMQAKAMAELNRGDEALRLLAEDDSTNANLLRVDIAWRGQKWDAAALALNKVIGPPPPAGQILDPGASQLVLNRAVALALAGDGTGLSQMRKDFEPAMKGGPNEDAFRVLTRPEQALGLIDVSTIRSRVAEVDMFQKFLKNYRGKQTAAKPTS